MIIQNVTLLEVHVALCKHRWAVSTMINGDAFSKCWLTVPNNVTSLSRVAIASETHLVQCAVKRKLSDMVSRNATLLTAKAVAQEGSIVSVWQAHRSQAYTAFPTIAMPPLAMRYKGHCCTFMCTSVLLT